MISGADAATPRGEIANEFRRAAEVLFKDAPLYRALCGYVADTPELLRLAGHARPGQSAVLMLLGAVHEAILAELVSRPGADHPLAAMYTAGNLDGDVNGSSLAALFTEFCARRRAELETVIATGRVQTNEIGRSVYLRLAAEWLGQVVSTRQLSWIELGASAGLNLLWDRFEITWVRDGQPFVRGDPASGVRLECSLSGAPSPVEAGSRAPAVVERLGVDIDPPDLSQANHVNRVLAFVWADHQERLARTRAAITAHRAHGITVVAGDATTDLIAHARAMRSDTLLCVAHTFLTSQLPASRAARIDEQLATLSEQRQVARIAVEWIEDETRAFAELWQRGSFERTWLGRGHPHGRSIEWWAHS